MRKPIKQENTLMSTATPEEKAMAFDLLVASDHVKPGKASHALLIARHTLRRFDPSLQTVPEGKDC